MNRATTNLFGTPAAKLLVGVLVVAAFAIGFLYTKIQMLETSDQAVQGVNNQPAVAAQPGQATYGTASTDDDPVLGDAKAPITIIEFSDYECPFCKRHFDQTYTQLKEQYIDTGKAKLVYRDFPLAFHDPMATKEAIAANCAGKQNGDSGYFVFHDEVFARTTSNGNGLTDADITTIATDLGLNLNSFESCLADQKQRDEISQDIAAGSAAGVSGTPTFLIGKTTKNGDIEGELLVGAQPFAAFQAIIDPLL